LFFKKSTVRNGHIEIAELVQMMTELKRATGVASVNDNTKTQSDAECVMKILDADGNGTLEAEEFVKWVVTGLTRAQSERNEVASMSQINRRMDNFLTSVSIVADELEILGNDTPIEKSPKVKEEKPVETEAEAPEEAAVAEEPQDPAKQE
jgi:hypothetical protein